YAPESPQTDEPDMRDWSEVPNRGGTSPFDPATIRTPVTAEVPTDNWQQYDTSFMIQEKIALYANHNPNEDTNFHSHHETNSHHDRDADPDTDHTPDHEVDQPANHLPNDYPDTLGKQNKDETKPNETKRAAAAVLRFYEGNFGVAGPYITESIVWWLEALGEK